MIRTCPDCREVWTDTTARFCGRCGAPLAPGGADPVHGRATRTAAAPSGQRRPERTLVLVAASGLVVAVALAVGASVDLDEVTEADGAVELPTTEGMASASPVPGRQIVPVAGSACVPDGCQRWRFDVPPGITTAGSGLVIHTASPDDADQAHDADQVDDAPGELNTPDEIDVTAIEAKTGAILWRRSYPSHVATEVRPHAVVLDAERVLLVLDGRVDLLDGRTGATRWERDVPGQVSGVRTVGSEALLVPIRPSDPGSPGEGAVALLETATGTVAWQREDVELLTVTSSSAVLIGGRSGARVMVAVDLQTGEPRWSTRFAGSDSPRVHADDRVLVSVVDDTATIVDPDTGEHAGGFPVEVAQGERVEVAGPLLVVSSGSGSDLRTLRRDARAYVLPTGEVVADVVSVHRLRAPLDARQGAVAGEPPPGVVVVTEDGQRATLQRIEADGARRWQRDLPAGTCCWRIDPGVGDATFVLVPADVGTETADAREVALTDAETGRVIRTTQVPELLGGHGSLRWVGELGIAYRSLGTEVVTELLGPDGRAALDGQAALLLEHPLPVLRTTQGLVGLEPEGLTTEEG